MNNLEINQKEVMVWGLTIVKLLVELHNGKIFVSSTPYKETTFSLYIPLKVKLFFRFMYQKCNMNILLLLHKKY